MPAQSAEVVRLEKLSKHYVEGGQLRPILDAADASFCTGELVAIRGRSGTGKSTLLNLIAGIDEPDSGRIFVDGQCVTDLSPRRRTEFRRDHIGFVFQFFNLIPTLTVYENVALPAELAGGAHARAVTTRALQLLDEVGLAARRDSFPDKLSGGEQQRVAIARALVCDPRLVLADEPTGNLDEANSKLVMDLLDRVTRRDGRSLLIVTHSRRVAALADRVFNITHGHLEPDAG